MYFISFLYCHFTTQSLLLIFNYYVFVSFSFDYLITYMHRSCMATHAWTDLLFFLIFCFLFYYCLMLSICLFKWISSDIRHNCTIVKNRLCNRLLFYAFKHFNNYFMHLQANWRSSAHVCLYLIYVIGLISLNICYMLFIYLYYLSCIALYLLLGNVLTKIQSKKYGYKWSNNIQ